MDGEHDPIKALITAAQSRHAEQTAVLAAVEQFTAALYQAVETVSQELVLGGAPGASVARRQAAGRLAWLRFQWIDTHLAFVPHDEIALPPEKYQLGLPGRLGRVLLFQTERADDTLGRVLRDYLIDAEGSWHVRGIGQTGQQGRLDEAAARGHVLQLLADLHTGLFQVWREYGEVRAFDEPNGGRAIGFHAQ